VSVSLVARRYATALLELGVETGQLDTIVRDINAIAEVYAQSHELRNAIENPIVAHPAKKATMTEVAQRLGIGQLAQNAVLLMIDRRRIRTLVDVARQLREMGDAKKGLLRAEVTSAAPLSDDYYGRLQAQLERMTGKRVVLEKREDPGLIAGLVTRIGDRIIDGSLRTRLVVMRDALRPHD
jgi:F-type H+-transporting ATPase subunit delta